MNHLYRNRYQNLQAQFREKDRIISLVSHHLRGPLASTQGISDLIQTYVENGECEKTMAVIQHLENSFRDLMKLTDHLLTWAASDSSDLKLKPEACDIEVPIAESLSALNFQIQLNEIHVD